MVAAPVAQAVTSCTLRLFDVTQYICSCDHISPYQFGGAEECFVVYEIRMWLGNGFVLMVVRGEASIYVYLSGALTCQSAVAI